MKLGVNLVSIVVITCMLIHSTTVVPGWPDVCDVGRFPRQDGQQARLGHQLRRRRKLLQEVRPER
jgi:hypothetical protein